MKAILIFNLPDDKYEHDAAVHGTDWSLVCWDLDQKLRNWLKYGHEFKTADEVLEEVREELYDSMRDYNLEFYP